MKPQNRRAVGLYFENVAEEWLFRSNYEIISRNWHNGHAELDLIVEKSNFRAFVEVKYLSGTSNNFPETKINSKKWNNILKSAHQFNVQYPHNKRIRFDVIAIIKNKWSIQLVHYKDSYTGFRSSYY